MSRLRLRNSVLSMLCACGAASAQNCTPGWSAPWSAPPNDTVFVVEGLDPDAAGPQPASLFTGGYFTSIGGVSASRVARWDGQAWHPLGSGLNNAARAFAVFDDDGPGPQPGALVVGGGFTQAGGAPASRIARWDGATWSDLGGGMNDQVRVLGTFDEDDQGPGPPALFAGGQFTLAGGAPALRIARWDGGSWSALGAGANSWVLAMAVFDDDEAGPLAPALYVAGGFSAIGGVNVQGIARWDGSAWSAAAGSASGDNWVLTLHAVAEGPLRGLYAGGTFSAMGGTPAWIIARWSGASWAPLGPGLMSSNPEVWDIVDFDEDDAGPAPLRIFASGRITHAGALPVSYLAAWDGVQWSPVGGGTDSPCGTLASFNDGAPGLFAGGNQSIAGGIPAPHLARWGCPLCYPDCNRDGVLTVADFGCFQTKFVLQDPYADCNADGAHSVADFGCFQTKFVVGCP